jgi:hypothetical protein
MDTGSLPLVVEGDLLGETNVTGTGESSSFPVRREMSQEWQGWRNQIV